MVVCPFQVSREGAIASWELIVREARSHLDSRPAKLHEEHKFSARDHTSSMFPLRLFMAKSAHSLEPC